MDNKPKGTTLPDHLFTSLLLAPILLGQAIYTRKVTPRLPEPAGPRAGCVGSGPSVKLLILGDSAAAGVGVTCQSEALSGALSAKLSTRYRLEWRLLAETGLGAAELIDKLNRGPAFSTDFVLISIGVNDITRGLSAKRWISKLTQLQHQLINKYKAKTILFTSVPPMGRFPALPQPLRWYLGRKADLFNRHLKTFAQAQPNLEFIGVDFPITLSFIAEDGFHPSRTAYDLWSDLVVERISDISGHHCS
ncbi:MAG: lipase [Gammaproteobacteria bacterium]|nr:MAG: lipase [Gammaproteobacteria bacterium]